MHVPNHKYDWNNKLMVYRIAGNLVDATVLSDFFKSEDAKNSGTVDLTPYAPNASNVVYEGTNDVNGCEAP